MKPKNCDAKPKRYPSDLTRTQWKRLKRLLPEAKPGGRPRSVDLREVLDGIFYIVRGGCVLGVLAFHLPPCVIRLLLFSTVRKLGTRRETDLSPWSRGALH